MDFIYKLNVEDDIIKIDDNFLSNLKHIFSGCRVNFLFGAGFSANVLGILDNNEVIFEALRVCKETDSTKKDKITILNAYMYWEYFYRCFYPISEKMSDVELENYFNFSQVLYTILSEKSNPSLDKQANIFTTNYDPIIEIIFDHSNCICNDGFEGRISPAFSTDNYSKTYLRQAVVSNRKAEIPSVNLLKLHGSVTWRKSAKNKEILYQQYRELLHGFYDEYKDLFEASLMNNIKNHFKYSTKANIEDKIDAILSDSILDSELVNVSQYETMLAKYKDVFLIVNPTKEKFHDTLLNKNYYELLRIFSNELEKENSLLVVEGFSFKDEHILDLTKRSMLNPSLKLLVFCYDEKAVEDYEKIFNDSKNHNITYVCIDGKKLTIKEFNEILGHVHI